MAHFFAFSKNRRTFLATILGLAGAFVMTGTAHSEIPELLQQEIPPGTKLVIGDPQTQVALELSGLVNEIPFEVEFAQVSGGPQSWDAFRARAVDVSSVAEIPSIHATFTDLPTRNIAARVYADPENHQIYDFGIAPGVEVNSLEDFRGKRIAYSPGQAQGALVLKALNAAGLTTDDVELVEIPSTGDVYVVALAGGQVDIAPLGGTNVKRYINQYERDGASLLDHNLRDDAGHLYAPQWVLDDPAKAAALAQYIAIWTKANEWITENPEEWIQGYYVENQGLTYEDGEFLLERQGVRVIPESWDEVIERHQETINIIAQERDLEPYDAEINFDRRFEGIPAAVLNGEI